MEFFKDLVDSGQFHLGNYVHMECAWFSFPQLIQTELNKIKREWNIHFTRKSRHDNLSGVPDELYFLP